MYIINSISLWLLLDKCLLQLRLVKIHYCVITISICSVTSRAVLATKEKHRFSNTQQFIQDGKISISQHRLRC